VLGPTGWPRRSTSPVTASTCRCWRPATRSPFWKEIDLQRYGLVWKWPEIDCAHPLDDGTAGVLYRSIEATTARMGADARRWRAAVGDLAAGFDGLAQDLFRPVINVPRHPIHLARFGPRALLPATVMARWFRTEQARGLFGGAAAHVYTRLDRPLTAAPGLLFLAGGHRYGWPVAQGGSGSIIQALAAALRAHGGTVTTGVTVAARGDIPDADIVMLDLSPAAALKIYGDVMPGRIRRSYERYRQGSSAFKVDFDIDGDIPWTNPDCRRAAASMLVARSPRSPTPNVNAHKARWCNGHSSSSGSSTWPTRPGRRATSIRYGPTPTCHSATPATPPAP